jgi:hypothetical protein
MPENDSYWVIDCAENKSSHRTIYFTLIPVDQQVAHRGILGYLLEDEVYEPFLGYEVTAIHERSTKESVVRLLEALFDKEGDLWFVGLDGENPTQLDTAQPGKGQPELYELIRYFLFNEYERPSCSVLRPEEAKVLNSLSEFSLYWPNMARDQIFSA